MKALLVIASLVAALVAAASASAGAAAGNGAIVVNLSGCNPTPFGLSCYEVRTVTNVTETPSGNRSYVTNGVTGLTYANPFNGCSMSQSQPVHVHWLQKDGDLQSYSERRSATNEIHCGSISQTCVMTFELHYANGDVQLDRQEVVCTDR